MVMKKIVLLAAALVFLASCGRQGEQGPPGQNAYFNIIDVFVDPQDWSPYGTPGDVDYQYFFEFNAPEIDALAFEQSLVIGYLFDNGTSYILPNTINYGDYTREYSLYYGVGYIGFIIKESDLRTVSPSDFLEFKVYVIDPAATRSEMTDWTQDEWKDYLNDKEVYELTVDGE